MKIILYQYKQSFIYKNTIFLEIFIKAYFQNKVHSSFHELLHVKSKCQSSDERFFFQYL